MRLFWTILLGLVATPAAAQFSAITGEARDLRGEALDGAAVVLDDLSGARVGTTTDSLGQFAFLNVRPGTYTVAVSHVGFGPAVDTLAIGFNERHILRLVLEEQATTLEDVTVEDARANTTPVRQPGQYQIQASDLARLPVPGLSADLMGHLLTVPGANLLGDSGGHLFVRGGTPTQNLVLVDGMPLYQPFHIVGFYSAFPADIISYADVFAGGFGARYGGRLSSVIDVTTRNGNKRQVAGAVSLAPFLSTARIEIPLQRDRMSIMLSGRESVIERIGPALAAGDYPFRFGDYFGKFHAFLNRTSSFSATAIKTYDRGEFETAEGTRRTVSWSNTAYGGRYLYLPPDFPVMTQFAVYLSRFESQFSSDASERTSEATGVNADISFTYLLGAHQLDFGIFARSNGFDFAIGRSRAGSGSEDVTEGGGYLDFSLSTGPHFDVRAGVRAHSFSNATGTSLEPRLRLQLRPGGILNGHVLGLAGGIHHQQIVGLTALEDVTDVFIAWTQTPNQRPVPRAMHLIGSWSRAFGHRSVLRAEGYTKWLSHLSVPRYDRLSDRLLEIGELDGIARGLDLQLQHAGESLYLVLGYALAEVQYEGLIPWPPDRPISQTTMARFHPAHDRRHQVSVASEYRAGPYRFRALWQLGSGRPFSQVYGFYPHIAPDEPDDGFRTAAGEAAVAFGAPFQGRTPAYHRLDVSIERRFTAGLVGISVQAGVVNAYDRRNLFDYDLSTGERVDQLPLIPYAGVRVDLGPHDGR